jgi:hypothetical protein
MPAQPLRHHAHALSRTSIAPLPQLPPQTPHRQPQKVWPLPPPRPVEDPLPRHPWHGPPQDRTRCGRSRASQALRGCPSAIRPQEAHGRAGSPPRPPPEAWPQVLHGQGNRPVFIGIDALADPFCSYSASRTRSAGVTRTSSTASRRSGRSRHRPSTSARWVYTYGAQSCSLMIHSARRCQGTPVRYCDRHLFVPQARGAGLLAVDPWESLLLTRILAMQMFCCLDLCLSCGFPRGFTLLNMTRRRCIAIPDYAFFSCFSATFQARMRTAFAAKMAGTR